MATTLLQLTLAVEPDRQRLMRFVLEAVDALGGNSFRAASELHGPLQELADLRQGRDTAPTVALELDDSHLRLCWDSTARSVAELPAVPDSDTVTALTTRLQQATEAVDPELLRQRNAEISRELEAAKARANAEMDRLERNLADKQAELQDTIRQAETDDLTGLLNRGAFEKRLAAAVRRSQRQGEPLSLILLDLDFFKAINDSHGHQVGDRYLQRMALAMADAVREDVDLCCRVGGDEFSVIAFADIHTAEGMARRVLEAMEGQLSIGVAQLHGDETGDDVVKRADRALYAAKNAGRGRITNAEHTGDSRAGAADG
jgi:diguanylate cyclase (GGDEF)-like protein